MVNFNRAFAAATTLTLAMSCGFLWGETPALAQTETATEDPAPIDEEETEAVDAVEADAETEVVTEAEEPELPESMLILPEEDPDFVPDPNRIPLEDDFLFMPQARNPLFWRLEWREQLGGTSNADYLPVGTASLTHRTSVSGILRYTLPSETQILARSQAFLSNYFNAPQQDQLLGIPLSLTASQWLGRWNFYGGYVPLVSTTLQRNENVQRFDQDFLVGATYYLPIEQHYFFAGYQLDYYLAQSAASQYVGNQLLAGYRHTIQKDLFAFADARVQPRSYLGTNQLVDELRLGAGVALQWHILRPWLILEGRGDYNQGVSFSSPDRNVGVWSLGINLIGAIQSQN